MSILKDLPPTDRALEVGDHVEVTWGSDADFVRYVGNLVTMPGTVSDEAAFGAADSISESYVVIPTFGERVTGAHKKAIEPLANLVFGRIGNIIGPSADSHKASTAQNSGSQISTDRTEVVVRILEG